MTRLDLLKTLVRQARANDFPFRKWYTSQLGLPWTSFDEAIETLSSERRYYALIFSHEFAQALWKDGEKMTFVLPNSSFQRLNKNGEIITVERRAFTRRSAREGAWRFHLQQLALAEEPLRYMRRYLGTAEHLEPNALSPSKDFDREPTPEETAAAAAAAQAEALKEERLKRLAPIAYDILKHKRRKPTAKLT